MHLYVQISPKKILKLGNYGILAFFFLAHSIYIIFVGYRIFFVLVSRFNGPGIQYNIHMETCVSLIVLLLAYWRGDTTKKCNSKTDYKLIMNNILM